MSSYDGNLSQLSKFYKDLQSNSSNKKQGEVLHAMSKTMLKIIDSSPVSDNQKTADIPFDFMDIYFTTMYTALEKTLHATNPNAIPEPYYEEFEKIEDYKKMLDECKYYKGFHFDHKFNWVLDITDPSGTSAYKHKSQALCFRRKEENTYYPYEYLAVAIDFQMERDGVSASGARESLRNTLDYHFNGILRTGGSLEEIKSSVEEKNLWKKTFYELFKIASEQTSIPEEEDYKHNCKLDIRDSNAPI